MTKTRSTKRALLTSGLVLIMCITMLIGTTFAWFTDSVTSGRNQIVAGNLDVELEYWNGNDYAPVTSATKLFNDNALWEPGYTEVAYLKVSNLGSLALKYQLNVNVFGETLGKTKGGADIKLSEHLVFKTVESNDDLADAYATREAAVAAAGTEKGLKAYNGESKALEQTGDADYVALIIYMPTTVGNEANHNGTDVPSIEMGVSLFATQFTYEKDSFDKYYDKFAEYDGEISNVVSLKAALTKGGTYKILKSKGAKEFGFDGFNFEKIQFTSEDLPHIYIKNRMLSGIEFIRFIFENNENSNMVLDRLSVLYAVGQPKKGI